MLFFFKKNNILLILKEYQFLILKSNLKPMYMLYNNLNFKFNMVLKFDFHKY
jgi:hypothetical protein